MCGVALVLLALTSAADVPASPVALTGKLLSAGAFQMVYMLPGQFFPSSLRASSFGVASSAGRLAAVAVPSLADRLSLEESSLLSATLAGAAALAVLSLTSDPTGDDDDDEGSVDTMRELSRFERGKVVATGAAGQTANLQ